MSQILCLSRRRVKSTKPPKCEVELLARPTYPSQHCRKGVFGLLSINGTVYTLLPLGESSRDGYRLVNTKNSKVYDVDTSSGFAVCDCPDYQVRRGTSPTDGCKHCLALTELRRQGAI